MILASSKTSLENYACPAGNISFAIKNMILSKKHFGQHFLNNKNILQAMIDAGKISKKDVVLEIGPGLGSLTELLGLHAKKVIAIEKDHRLVPLLQEKFARNKNIEIKEGDVLRFDFKKLKIKSKYKIVANIPYYITGKFLRLFLSGSRMGIGFPSDMIIMVQREVAERIVAKDGKESLLSLSVKAYGAPLIVRIVPRGAFVPSPEVDSAIIAIHDISDIWFRKNKVNSREFFNVLRSAFQKKRKTLKNSIKIEGIFAQQRPEDLALEDWAIVCRKKQSLP